MVAPRRPPMNSDPNWIATLRVPDRPRSGPPISYAASVSPRAQQVAGTSRSSCATHGDVVSLASTATANGGRALSGSKFRAIMEREV
jgi:hypothetical protein